MSQILLFAKDNNGFNTFSPSFSDQIYDTTLSVGVAQSLTVPKSSIGGTGQQMLAIFAFEPGTTVFVSNGGTADAPGGAFAASDSEMNPTSRIVAPDDVLSFITTDATAYVCVSFYALQN